MTNMIIPRIINSYNLIMKTPYLRREEEVKTAHGYTWSDYYSWIHQSNCLEILRDKSKLNPEVRKYLEEEKMLSQKKI